MKSENHLSQLFAEICNIYGKELQRFIFTLTRKDQFAMEEIFQNTMVEALVGLQKLRDEEKMKSWLFSIAKAEDWRYYQKYQNMYNIEISGMDDEWDKAMSKVEFHDFTKALANRDMMGSLLRELSDEEQQIYLLHYYYDLPLKEISAVLQINYNTLRSVHVRTLEKLKRIITERGGFYE